MRLWFACGDTRAMHAAFLAATDRAAEGAVPLHLIAAADLDGWAKAQPPALRAFAMAVGFSAEPGKVLLAPDAEGRLAHVAVGAASNDAFALAPLSAGALPPGDYVLAAPPKGVSLEALMLGWADGAYRFSRYKGEAKPERSRGKKATDKGRRLVAPAGVDLADIARQAGAIDFLRDLVNTPASDLGPAGLAEAASTLAKAHDARIEITQGAALEAGYPMVAAVGRAAAEAPRMIEITWAKAGGRADAPVLALVGKGVAFNSGGLNIKTGSGMAIMKKDMGGAAHALALARLVMEAGLDVRLSLLVPAVENAVGAGAFRPGDILKSRKGLTVEIEDTDAEGRLILGDALARASELKPDLLLDFATLTGAARTALGPELAPLYTDDETLAADMLAASAAVADPMWRMPLWKPYEAELKSPIADMKNLGDGAMAGSITAALFLKAFVDAPSWAHFDVWAWRQAKYGRPAGAAANGLRAAWQVLKRRYS